jgi:hypothetical protein
LSDQQAARVCQKSGCWRSLSVPFRCFSNIFIAFLGHLLSSLLKVASSSSLQQIKGKGNQLGLK